MGFWCLWVLVLGFGLVVVKKIEWKRERQWTMTWKPDSCRGILYGDYMTEPLESEWNKVFAAMFYHNYMGGYQNYDPFLGTLSNSMRCRIRTGIQKGTMILTTTHIGIAR